MRRPDSLALMRKIVLFTILVLATLVAAVAAHVTSALPRPSGARLEVDAEVVGVLAGAAYAYVVQRGSTLVLVDAGSDRSGRALLAELARRGATPEQVSALLVTHGHYDHFSAAALFPRAIVYVGGPDHVLLRGDRYPRGPLAKQVARFTTKPLLPGSIATLLPGDVVRVGELTFDVIAVPGHTAGSMMFRLGDVLFTGDSLLVDGDGLSLASWLFSDSVSDNRRSLARLAPVPFTIIADGHVGIARDGRARYERLMGLAAHSP